MVPLTFWSRDILSPLTCCCWLLSIQEIQLLIRNWIFKPYHEEKKTVLTVGISYIFPNFQLINANPSTYYAKRRKTKSEGSGRKPLSLYWMAVHKLHIPPTQFVSTLGAENIPGEFSISEPLDIMTVLWPSNKIWTESLCRRRKTAPPLPPPLLSLYNRIVLSS